MRNYQPGGCGTGAKPGLDLLGFNFYPRSPRYVTPARAGEIIRTLSDEVISVGLFVNAPIERIVQVLQDCPLKVVQLHGDETNAECQATAKLGVKIIKAVRIRQKNDVSQVKNYHVDWMLLDAFREELYGGTGHCFDWSWLDKAERGKIFLAGGITPDNVSEALAAGTYALDLCSGVEKKPGIKDADKLKQLFTRIDRYYEKL